MCILTSVPYSIITIITIVKQSAWNHAITFRALRGISIVKVCAIAIKLVDKLLNFLWISCHELSARQAKISVKQCAKRCKVIFINKPDHKINVICVCMCVYESEFVSFEALFCNQININPFTYEFIGIYS